MKHLLSLFLLMGMLSLFSTKPSFAQNRDRVVRIAKITVDPAQLTAYQAALKEGIETAVSKEPGVLAYYAVADKNEPSHITILEVYANPEAYQKHIETPHFKKYKATVQSMVKSLELTDVNVIDFVSKK
jgi:quinol monooxygenase YgiN